MGLGIHYWEGDIWKQIIAGKFEASLVFEGGEG